MTCRDPGPWRVLLIEAGSLEGTAQVPYAALSVMRACCAGSVMAAWGICRPQDHTRVVDPDGRVCFTYDAKTNGPSADAAMLDRVVLRTSSVADETRSLLVTLAVLRHGSLRQRLHAGWFLLADLRAWWQAGCPDFYAGDDQVPT
jgi:hypothetical protein